MVKQLFTINRHLLIGANSVQHFTQRCSLYRTIKLRYCAIFNYVKQLIILEHALHGFEGFLYFFQLLRKSTINKQRTTKTHMAFLSIFVWAIFSVRHFYYSSSKFISFHMSTVFYQDFHFFELFS